MMSWVAQLRTGSVEAECYRLHVRIIHHSNCLWSMSILGPNVKRHAFPSSISGDPYSVYVMSSPCGFLLKILNSRALCSRPNKPV